jgi:hypothetical protein
MTVPTPPNSDETAYAAFAIIDELIALLVEKNLINHDEVKELLEQAGKRLSNENNFEANRTSKFLAAARGRQSAAA